MGRDDRDKEHRKQNGIQKKKKKICQLKHNVKRRDTNAAGDQKNI